MELTNRQRHDLEQAIEDAEYDLERAQHKYLQKTGWRYTSSTPGCRWMWVKALPDGCIIMTETEYAISIQRTADCISPDRLPATQPPIGVAETKGGDPWGGIVREWLSRGNTKEEVTTADILHGCLRFEVAKIPARQELMRVGRIMKILGWTKHRRTQGDRKWFYRRPEADRRMRPVFK